MTRYTDFSIDIETLGIGAGSIIASVGAVAFSAQEGGPLGPSLSLTLDLRYQSANLGMSVDTGTFIWWLGQSDAARAEMCSASRLEPPAALRTLSEFICANQEERPRIWAKSPSFDLVMLVDLYSRCKISPPWRYSDERDVRTIQDAAGIVPPPFEGAHTALGDAIAQADLIQASYWHLNIGEGRGAGN